ncbi:MAG: YcxB family protein [Clostridia bacterium]|nr:YcxB family protein [Clostridia bacterium]
MEIKAKCKYDLDSVKAWTRLNMFKQADPKKRMILWNIIYTILCIVIIWEIVTFGTDALMLILLGVCLLFQLLVLFLYFIAPKIQYKALAKMRDAENEYFFGDDTLKASTKGEEYNGASEIQYSFFVKAYETSKYLFIYQTNNQVFVVDKSTIEGGTAEDIKNKLSAYMKDKYVVCKY